MSPDIGPDIGLAGGARQGRDSTTEQEEEEEDTEKGKWGLKPMRVKANIWTPGFQPAAGGPNKGQRSRELV